MVPGYVKTFSKALSEVRIKSLGVPCCEPEVKGVHGILTTSKIQYNTESTNLLGRQHEYLFWLPDQMPVSVSLQLYLNITNHWRLFAYSDKGMLLSVNLTLERAGKGVVALQQRLKIQSRDFDSKQRSRMRDELVHCLRSLGYQIDNNNQIVFGTFDGIGGNFMDTNSVAFVREFVVAALVKGHFMQNKGYRLPNLNYERYAIASQRSNTGRSIPDGLRFQVLQRDGRCLACGTTSRQGRMHVDHIVPWSQGGRTELDNLQTLCARCNLGKGNRSCHDFRR